MKNLIQVKVTGEMPLADTSLSTVQEAFGKLDKLKDVLAEIGIEVTEFSSATVKRRGEKA